MASASRVIGFVLAKDRKRCGAGEMRVREEWEITLIEEHHIAVVGRLGCIAFASFQRRCRVHKPEGLKFE
jgi:hypothetical protein